MERKSGLGRGLASLLPTDGGGQGETQLRDLPINDISPNPYQPRVHFDEEALVELAASVRELGVLQPVLVRPVADGRFELIAGERRWRAAKRAGLDVIPAVVREAGDLAAVEQALVENIHRQDLTALEEAAAFQQLIEDFHLTHDDVAKRVSKSRAAVTNTLRLLQLPPPVQHLLVDGRLSAGHARALLGVSNRAEQEALALRVVSEGLSVRAVEDLVRGGPSPTTEPSSDGLSTGRSSSPGITPLRPPGLLELEELLGEFLHTRVKVTAGANRGKIAIDFADLEDLERIYRVMTEASRRA